MEADKDQPQPAYQKKKAKIYHSDNQSVANWCVSFTIKNAWEAKCHAEMYSSRWRKETWDKWFKFLPTIGVKYSKNDKAYYDIKK